MWNRHAARLHVVEVANQPYKTTLQMLAQHGGTCSCVAHDIRCNSSRCFCSCHASIEAVKVMGPLRCGNLRDCRLPYAHHSVLKNPAGRAAVHAVLQHALQPELPRIQRQPGARSRAAAKRRRQLAKDLKESAGHRGCSFGLRPLRPAFRPAPFDTVRSDTGGTLSAALHCND